MTLEGIATTLIEETERWVLSKSEVIPYNTLKRTEYKLVRKVAFRGGLFEQCTTSYDFIYERDAKEVLALLDQLEMMVEADLAEAIEESTALREKYFNTAPFARSSYNKTALVTRATSRAVPPET